MPTSFDAMSCSAVTFAYLTCSAAILTISLVTPAQSLSAAQLSAAEESPSTSATARQLLAAESGADQRASSHERLLASAMEATHGIVIGNPNGDVTLVEFFDYNCDYCREVARHIRELLRTDPKLRIVLRSFPLHGAESKEAAQVTWAVSRLAGPVRAYELHTRMMDSRGSLDGQRALALAAQMGLDADRLRQLMSDDVGQQAVEHNRGLTQRLRLTGTPVFIVGGEVVLGATDATRLRNIITNARTCGATHC